MLLGVPRCSLGAPAATAAPRGRPRATSAVIEVSGLLDPVLVDFVETQIEQAEDRGAVALVLQLNSSRRRGLRRPPRAPSSSASSDAAVPVDVWVGPSGSQASGDATALLAAARTVGVAPGQPRRGHPRPPGRPGPRRPGGRRRQGQRRRRRRPRPGRQRRPGHRAVRPRPRRRARAGWSGRRPPARDPGPLRSAPAVGPAAPHRRQPAGGLPAVRDRPGPDPLRALHRRRRRGRPRGGRLAGARLLRPGRAPHQPGGGGAAAPGRWLGFGIDVQTGVPRVWSGIATVAFIVGSVLLYDGLSLSWITLLVAIVGMALAMLGGMPAMVRTRFSTPTIGREWMIGEVGTAVGRVAPDGIVTVRERPVAGPHQPGHPHRGRSDRPGGVDRRPPPRGRTARRRCRPLAIERMGAVRRHASMHALDRPQDRRGMAPDLGLFAPTRKPFAAVDPCFCRKSRR